MLASWSETSLNTDEDDVETLDDDEDDAGTSDDAGTMPKPRQRTAGGSRGTMAAAGKDCRMPQQGR